MTAAVRITDGPFVCAVREDDGPPTPVACFDAEVIIGGRGFMFYSVSTLDLWTADEVCGLRDDLTYDEAKAAVDALRRRGAEILADEVIA